MAKHSNRSDKVEQDANVDGGLVIQSGGDSHVVVNGIDLGDVGPDTKVRVVGDRVFVNGKRVI